eukprot:g40322.t1
MQQSEDGDKFVWAAKRTLYNPSLKDRVKGFCEIEEGHIKRLLLLSEFFLTCLYVKVMTSFRYPGGMSDPRQRKDPKFNEHLTTDPPPGQLLK